MVETVNSYHGSTTGTILCLVWNERSNISHSFTYTYTCYLTLVSIIQFPSLTGYSALLHRSMYLPSAHVSTRPVRTWCEEGETLVTFDIHVSPLEHCGGPGNILQRSSLHTVLSTNSLVMQVMTADVEHPPYTTVWLQLLTQVLNTRRTHHIVSTEYMH